MFCNQIHVMLSIPKEFCRNIHSKLLNTKIWMVYLDYKISELLTFQKALSLVLGLCMSIHHKVVDLEDLCLTV